MLSRYFKNLPRLTSNARLFAPAVSYNFSLIDKFLKREKKEQPVEEPIHENFEERDSLVSKKILEQNKVKREKEEAEKAQQAQVSTEVNEQEQEEKQLTVEEKTTALQKEVDVELDLPYKLYGSIARADRKSGYMGDRIFTYHKIPRIFITNHLSKIYAGVLHSIANRDTEFLNEYLETSFAKRLDKSIENLFMKGYNIKCVNDVSGKKGEPIAPNMEILDMVVVKGLSVDRSENRAETEYHKWVDIEDMGLIVYTPLEISNPENFIDPEKNKTMYDNIGRVAFRALVEIQNPLKLVIVRPNGEEIIVDEKYNNFKHTAIFETQMVAPPKFTSSYKLENLMEWIGKFKFGSWKLADLDNWMLGNPMILKENVRELYKDEIFKGSKYDPEAVIDIKRV